MSWGDVSMVRLDRVNGAALRSGAGKSARLVVCVAAALAGLLATSTGLVAASTGRVAASPTAAAVCQFGPSTQETVMARVEPPVLIDGTCTDPYYAEDTF